MRHIKNRPEYNRYVIKKRDMLFIIPTAVMLDYIFVYLFYKSIVFCVISYIPVCILLAKLYKKHNINIRKQRLAKEFEDMLGCVATALRAGYSLENSFAEAERELVVMYGKDNDILTELELITSGLKINRTVNDLISDMAKRSGVEEILSFSEILMIAKRSGGNIVDIVTKTANNMHDRREIEEEMKTIISGKRLEYRIMCMMPIIMLVFLKICSPGYLSVLYHNIVGVAVMTGCLIVYIISFFVAEKIMAFDVNVVVRRSVFRHRFKIHMPEKIFEMFKKYADMHSLGDELCRINPGRNRESVYKSFADDLYAQTFIGIFVALLFFVAGCVSFPDKLLYLFLMSIAVIIIFPYRLRQAVKSKNIARNNQMLIDYPDFVNRFALLIGAGSSMRSAFERLVNDYKKRCADNEDVFRYLYEELNLVVRELYNGVNEAQVYENFGNRVRLLSYMKFCTMLVQNLRKGNRYILEQLNMTAIDAYESKRDNIKRLGEEASSKLLLPMILEFVIVLVIIMYPALMAL